jgi:peptide/nickel transport system substrate-binding protein
LQIGRWAADYPDPDTFAHILLSREGNVGRICGTLELDRLIARGRAETVASARQAIYRQIEELIASDAILIPLFHEQAYRFARPEVEGLSVSFGIPTVAYENIRIKG